MALGTREDEVSVMTVLDALAQRSLHRFLRITGNGLEFINGYQARLICLGKIGKDFIQRNIRRLNICNDTAPGFPSDRNNDKSTPTFPIVVELSMPHCIGWLDAV